MSFEKKIWLNVPDETNLPDVPEGQDALARFDADNMNRIEEGIEESHNFTKDSIQNLVDIINNSPIVLDRTDNGDVRYNHSDDLLAGKILFTVRGGSNLPSTGEASIDFKLNRTSNYFPYKSYLSLAVKQDRHYVGSSGFVGNIYYHVEDSKGDTVGTITDGGTLNSIALTSDETYTLKATWSINTISTQSSSYTPSISFIPAITEYYTTSTPIVIK